MLACSVLFLGSFFIADSDAAMNGALVTPEPRCGVLLCSAQLQLCQPSSAKIFAPTKTRLFQSKFLAADFSRAWDNVWEWSSPSRSCLGCRDHCAATVWSGQFFNFIQKITKIRVWNRQNEVAKGRLIAFEIRKLLCRTCWHV